MLLTYIARGVFILISFYLDAIDFETRYNCDFNPSKVPEMPVILNLNNKQLSKEKSMEANRIDLGDPENIKTFNKEYLMNLNLLNNLFDGKAFQSQV